MTRATKPTRGGKRLGAGRKPASLPSFHKKLRATPERQAEFLAMMTGDAAKDFDLIFTALKHDQTLLNYSKPTAWDNAMTALQPEAAQLTKALKKKGS